MTDHDFVLNEILILGFPPIPLTKRNVLVATRAQINAVVDLVSIDHVHFIASAMARGGFSGGVALSEWDFALGVVTSSLLKNHAQEELGYLTVLTVEPILECLAEHQLLPKAVALEWDGLFTAKTEYFGVAEKNWAHSWIETDRDGHRARIMFATPDVYALEQMVKLLTEKSDFELTTVSAKVTQSTWEYRGDYKHSVGPIDEARAGLTEILLASGYGPVARPRITMCTLDEPVSGVTASRALFEGN